MLRGEALPLSAHARGEVVGVLAPCLFPLFSILSDSFWFRAISTAGGISGPRAPAAPGSTAPASPVVPALAPVAAHAPAVGSLEALFATPPGAANLRHVRDPDALWGFIDDTRDALMASDAAGQALRSQLTASDRCVVGELTLFPWSCFERIGDLLRARFVLSFQS